MNRLNYKIMIPIFIIVLVIGVFGISYALLSQDVISEKNYHIKIGNFSFEIGDEQNPISLTATYPMADSIGKETTPYTFKLTNSSKIKVDYVLTMEPDELNTLPQNMVKLNLKQGNNTFIDAKTLEEQTLTLASGVMEANESLDFSLRMWLNIDATMDVAGQTFKGKIKVVATQHVE